MAKQPMVTCPVCHEKFYREDTDFVQEGRRYYHSSCHAEKEKTAEYTQKIHDYCRELYGDMYVKTRIEKQIKELLNDGTGKTASGIYRTLVWHFQNNGGSIEKTHGGIGIVSYVYNDAMKYYQNMWEIQQHNKEMASQVYIQEEPDVFNIKPTPIQKPKRVNLFSIN